MDTKVDKLEKQEIIEVTDTTQCCSTRNVLWYLVFTGFAVNYLIRINLNIALVSMVLPRPKTNVSFTSECFIQNLTIRNISEDNTKLLNSTPPSITSNVTFLSPFNTLVFESRKFNWNEKQQGSILGSFFWLHWVTQIPGGILAGRYGTKIIFGLSNWSAALLCFIIPWMAYRGPEWLIFVRILQGLFAGFCWPAMHNLTASWIPPNERSKFVTSYLGSSVGVAITYPICGFVIDRWGWEVVFYSSGFTGTVWFAAWWLLIYDNPHEHPRITHNEREYIVNSLGQSVAKDKAPVPWGAILTDRTVLMNIVAQVGGVWGFFTLMTNGPSYFKFIHGWNIRETGLLSGLPHLLRMGWAYVFSQLGDYLLRSGKMSRPNVRKLATAVCCIGQGFFMLGLAYSGCDRYRAIVFLTLAVAIHGAVSTGPLASIVDISPNYAGVILGIINTIVASVGFLTPMVVGYLTYQNQTVVQWQKVFWIATLFLFVSGILYCTISNSKLKSWNSPEGEQNSAEKEMKDMRKNKEEGTADEKGAMLRSAEKNGATAT
ncbi:unnamed protein product [Acanthoscelides obtectus]|uniref:Major facilitator superfamily (MFS) profile domain-containing protein n=2 Tax=Acanthoscelides obtectus TaxID=200917 RepID=A0A9P0PU97_ACAOB|nr:unnamed protein product [Acanthoscelides obtectus]CAK1683303.1 Sialin [Acanthoscelides obtectus]